MKNNRPSDVGYAATAWFLDCEERAVRAVARVESGPHGAFVVDVPTVLFERHVFHRLTDGRFDDARVEAIPEGFNVLSSFKPGGYGPIELQYVKLDAAAKLDREAALMSCSWGLFQILGENYVQCGFTRLQSFVNAMYRSADDQLRVFALFLRHDERLTDALRSRRWADFAAVYNGPAYRLNRYDEKLAAAYAEVGP